MSEHKQSAGDDGNPKFGSLLLVLLLVVGLIGLITYASEAYYR